MDTTPCPRGLGIYTEHQKVLLFTHYGTSPSSDEFVIDASRDGFDFHPYLNNAEIRDVDGKKIALSACSTFHVAHVEGQYILTYLLKGPAGNQLRVAVSDTVSYWKDRTAIPGVVSSGAVVPYYKHNEQYVLYFGSDEIGIATSWDLTNWTVRKTPLLKPRPSKFDKHGIILGSVADTDEGIAVFYYAPQVRDGRMLWAVGAALFDRNNPEKLLWRCDTPVVPAQDFFDGRAVTPVGLIGRDDMVFTYWDLGGEGIVGLSHPKAKVIPKKAPYKLAKVKENPIIEPNPHHFWESKATFNPAAFYEDGVVHIIYRAVGDADVSVMGYATSRDGITIDERSKVPIYMPTAPFEGNRAGGVNLSPGPYTSGGIYGGCEDPRITKHDGRYYMTYVAYDGWSPPRVALTSISETDFHKNKWDWTPPVLISPPGVVDKNCVILPEKIRGKYVIFHRIFPNILVDYVDDLNFDGKTFLKGEHIIEPRANAWDSRKVGLGPPPMKTKDGWLTIYHAVDDRDAARYKMGAMLLDLENPTRVLYRCKSPILEPDQKYENEGLKYGVAYPCGAVIKGDNLLVYYGGADMVVCAAQANLNEFLGHLKHNESAQLVPLQLPQPVAYYPA